MRLNQLGELFRNGVGKLLHSQLPDRTKRLVFLASLSARLRESTSFDKETLQKINKAMVLCNSENALKLPVELSKVIWHNRTKYEICNDDICAGTFTPIRIQQIATHVVSLMPAWLRYGENDEIEMDVKTLIAKRSVVFS